MSLGNSIIQMVSINKSNKTDLNEVAPQAPAYDKPCLETILMSLVKKGEVIQLDTVNGKTITGRVTQFDSLAKAITLHVQGTDRRVTVFQHAIAMFGNPE